MLRLLVLISMQYLVSPCCIFDEFAGPILSQLGIPNEHYLNKRQVSNAWAFNHDDSNNHFKLKPQLEELHSTQQKFKNLNEETDEIYSNSFPLPPVNFMPEAPIDDNETDVDIPFDNPIIDEITLIELLNDLSDCVELKSVQALRRLCASKKEKPNTERLSRFQKLPDEQLEFEIQNKCKMVNSKGEKNAKEIKNLVKGYVAGNEGNNLDEDIFNESLLRLSNDGIGYKDTEEHFNLVSPHYNLQDGDKHLDGNANKQTIEDTVEPNIKDQARAGKTNQYPEEVKQELLRVKIPEETNKSYSDPEGQNVLLYSRAYKYDTTTININKIESDRALNDFFNPTKVKIGNMEYDVPIAQNDTAKDMSYRKVEDKRPSLENLPTDNKLMKDNLDSKISENVLHVNGRRSYNRPQYINENEVPVIKIITHEYPDGNVVSKVNGTEILINHDTPIEENYTNIFVRNINVQDNINVSEVLYKFSIPKSIPQIDKFYDTNRTQLMPQFIFNGRLYLIDNKEKIPAQFVQESNGNISVGLDLLSVCETENHDPDSVLFKLLCKCKNCSSEIS